MVHDEHQQRQLLPSAVQRVRRTTVLDVQRRLLQERNTMVSAHAAGSRRSAEQGKHIALLHLIQARGIGVPRASVHAQTCSSLP